MPYAGHVLTTNALNKYAGPVVEQSVNQIVQLTPLEQVNEKIHEITELVRERACKALSDASARLRDLESSYRATRVTPSTRENPFPSAKVMAPLRQSERLGRDVEDMATRIRGLPLLSGDKVWDRLRRGGLHELLQFDWGSVPPGADRVRPPPLHKDGRLTPRINRPP